MVSRVCERHLLEERLKKAVSDFIFTKTHLISIHENHQELLTRLRDLKLFPGGMLDSPIEQSSSTKCTLLVCGLLNAGKSRFLNEFLRGRVSLPCNNVACTGRFVRLRYSNEIYMNITDSTGSVIRSCPFDGKSPQMSEIQLSEALRGDEAALKFIVEIGIPHPMLQTGLEVIDCPGLGESETISNIFQDTVLQFEPTIILYLFDNRKGFSVSDCLYLDYLKLATLSTDCKLLFVANKIEKNYEAARRDRADSEEEEDEDGEDDDDKDDVEEEETEKEAEVKVKDEEKEKEDHKDEEKEGEEENNEPCSFWNAFDLNEIWLSIKERYPCVKKQDVCGLSGNMIYDHQVGCNVPEVFLDLQVALETRISDAIFRIVLMNIHLSKTLPGLSIFKMIECALKTIEGHLPIKQKLTLNLEATKAMDSEIDSFYFSLLRRFREIHGSKWNLNHYKDDYYKLRDVYRKEQDIQGFINTITIFIAVRYENISDFCLRLCYEDTNIRQQIASLERKLHNNRLVYNTEDSPLYQIKNVPLRSAKIIHTRCAKFFNEAKNEYLSMQDREETYFDFLKRYCHKEDILLDIFDHVHQDTKQDLHYYIRYKILSVTSKVDLLTKETLDVLLNLCETISSSILQLCSVQVEASMRKALEQLNSVDAKFDLTGGFKVHTCVLYDAPMTALTFRVQKAALQRSPYRFMASDFVYFEAVKSILHPDMFCDPFACFKNTDSTIYILSGSLRNRLLSKMVEFTNNEKLACISAVLEVLKNIHLNKLAGYYVTLRNFRPDILMVNKTSNGTLKIQMNLHCPSNPLLPMILGNDTLAPPFHIHPDLLRTYPYVTPAQEVYAFGWVVWMLAEGCGSKVPRIFQNTSTADEVSRLLLESCPIEVLLGSLDEINDRFTEHTTHAIKKLVKFCWTLPFDSCPYDIYSRMNPLLTFLKK